jgi:hypothetical protein
MKSACCGRRRTSATPNLYGLYASRTGALQALRDLADAHRASHHTVAG